MNAETPAQRFVGLWMSDGYYDNDEMEVAIGLLDEMFLAREQAGRNEGLEEAAQWLAKKGFGDLVRHIRALKGEER